MKVCSVSNYFSPYKIKLFHEIGKSVELTAVILPGDDGNRNSEWSLPENVSFKTYVIDKDYSKLIRKLAKENDVLIDSMYSTKYGMLAVSAFKKEGKKVLMDADGGIPRDRGFIVNKAMSFFMNRHDYMISTGYSTDLYYKYYDVPESKLRHYRFSSLSEADMRNHREMAQHKEEYRRELNIGDNFVVINVGRPIKVKGFNILLDAYMKTGMTDKIDLYIVGGEPQDDIKKIVDDNKLVNVHFIGLLSTEELNKYYAASDMMVFTSRGDVWGLVVNEAMSFGLPVVTSDKNGAGIHFNSIDESVIMCELEDREAYAKAIVRLYNDRNFYNLQSKKTIETIQGYTIENGARDIINILNGL
ncbi:MAG: glycosyltransferase family 4 protein [Erysipelotrichaceae bacterium]|nr:glycosyltransferase family 4 protein [Erysipelotrichaceae bacterium]